MKDDRDRLQLFDLIARDWQLPGRVDQVLFNGSDSAVAFACADGTVSIARTADPEPPDARVRRAADSARLTIQPRKTAFAGLRAVDHTAGRSTGLSQHGADNFLFATQEGRASTVTPGGIARPVPARAGGRVAAAASCRGNDLVALASGSAIDIFAGDGATPVARLSAPAEVTTLSFAGDGQVIAAGHAAGVSCWQVPGPAHPEADHATPGAPVALAWNHDGGWLAACLETGGVCLIDRSANRVIHRGEYPAPVRNASFSEPTATAATSGAFRVVAWSLATDAGAPANVVTGKAGLVLVDTVAACPTRPLVAVGYANGLLCLAAIGNAAEIMLRQDTGAAVTALAWSANGRFLGVGGSDGSAALVEFPDSMFKS